MRWISAPLCVFVRASIRRIRAFSGRQVLPGDGALAGVRAPAAGAAGGRGRAAMRPLPARVVVTTKTPLPSA